MGLNAAQRHWMDGKDLWTIFGIFVEGGSDDFLKLPARKASIEHDWMDADGIDVDLSRTFMKDRDIALRCAMVADDEAEFWNKRAGFIAQLRQPGPRRIEVNEFGPRSFYVYYKEMTSLTRYTRVLDGTTERIACKFVIVFTENEPDEPDNDDVFIVDEDNRFLIT